MAVGTLLSGKGFLGLALGGEDWGRPPGLVPVSGLASSWSGLQAPHWCLGASEGEGGSSLSGLVADLTSGKAILYTANIPEHLYRSLSEM